VAAAGAAVISGDWKSGLAEIKQAEKAAPQEIEVVSTATLSRMYYYQGLALHLKGAKESQVMGAWRASLAIDNDLVWDTSLIDDGDAWSLFEALRAEVRGRGSAEVGVPEKRGAAKIYVDGIERAPGDTVIAGEHLGQISCDDGVVRGTWTDFGRPMQWFKLCPDGVDTSVVVVEEEPSDEWAEFGPVFGPAAAVDDPGAAGVPGDVPVDGPVTAGATDDGAAEPSEAPASEGPASETPASEGSTDGAAAGETAAGSSAAIPTESPTETPAETHSETPAETPAETPTEGGDEPAADESAGEDQGSASPPAESAPPREVPLQPEVVTAQPGGLGSMIDDPLRFGLLAGGGSLVAASLVVNFAVVNPAYGDIQDANLEPARFDRTTADALEQRFSRGRWTTIILGATGAGMLGGTLLLDGVTPVVGFRSIGARVGF